jgi:monovalent cation:H+ antiporter-2, CPA2 family
VLLGRSLHLPPVLGYLLVGVAIGPHALHWIPASEESTYISIWPSSAWYS